MRLASVYSYSVVDWLLKTVMFDIAAPPVMLRSDRGGKYENESMRQVTHFITKSRQMFGSYCHSTVTEHGRTPSQTFE